MFNMKMQLKQLAIILLVIILSFVFKLSEVRRYDIQLVFILLTLVVLVCNKLMCWVCRDAKNGEGYQDFSSEINEFLGRDLPADASQADVRKYNEHLSGLGEKIDTMNTYLAEIRQHQQRPVGNGSGSGNAIDELNIQASQQIQDYRMRNMEEEIQRTTDLIKKAKLEEDSTKYKKIPVYSSCVVANADGSVSVAEPAGASVPTNVAASRAPNNGVVQEHQQDSTDLGMGAAVATGSGVTGIDGRTMTAEQAAMANNGNTGGVRDLLQSVLANGIEINLSS